MLEPIVKTTILPVDQAQAFELFTNRISEWWPLATHSLLSADGKTPTQVQFEPFEGGRLYEISDQGETMDWGQVTAWDAPNRLSFTWQVGSTPEQATQVEVSFERADQGGTRVTLVHSNWHVLGARAAELHANYTPGWDAVFHAGFAEFAAAQE